MPHALFRRRAALALPLLAVLPARAEAPARPRALLEVTGCISAPGGAARFDLAGLDALPQAGFATRTPWFDGPRAFSGVSGAGLFATLGATGAEVLATALNDYAVTIPAEDFLRAGLILATRIGGEPIPVREKGPVWIVYPFDTSAALRNEVVYSRCIWQLRRLDIRG